MLSAAWLPAFAKGGHWAELNQILHVGKWAKLVNVHEKIEGFPRLKIEELKYLFWDDFQLNVASGGLGLQYIVNCHIL